MRLCYFVHDLSDPAVEKRVGMFRAGGAEVALAGFQRRDLPQTIGGIVPVGLGRTADGRMIHRLKAICAASLGGTQLANQARGADAIVARNLESLILAVRARSSARIDVPVIYECLDVHRLLTAKGYAGVAMRSLEGRLSRRADLLMTSSPAFVKNYFQAQSRVRLPSIIVENKVFLNGKEIAPRSKKMPACPPWKIGWFGAIRCRRSLQILSSLTRALKGRVEVVIRGRPAYREFADFEGTVAEEPYISYLGPYRNPDDLPEIYDQVHFNWAIDFFEAGVNSSWLLPNRLYEGGWRGVVPIAVKSVATGQWLSERKMGVLIDEPIIQPLINFFEALDAHRYRSLSADVESAPQTDWLCTRSECIELVNTLVASKRAQSTERPAPAPQAEHHRN